jgi:hypothetical protein
MIYNKFSDLNGHTLEQDNDVWFTINGMDLQYRVRDNFLMYLGGDNSKVFAALGIEDAKAFATAAYGYQAVSVDRDDWPECRTRDYAALTKLVLALYAKIEGKKAGSFKVAKIAPIVKHIVLKDSCGNFIGTHNSYEEAVKVKPSVSDGQYTVYRLLPVAVMKSELVTTVGKLGIYQQSFPVTDVMVANTL